MFSKEIDSSAPILDVFSKRWSGVAYDSSRQVSELDLRSLAEAARWTPSCYGDEPWRFIFCRKDDNNPAWQDALDCLADANQTWCQHAPVLLLICHDTLSSFNNKPNAWSQYDVGAATMSLCLQASQLGLMTHQMAGFNADKARKHFQIPERFNPFVVMSLGYQLPKDDIPETLANREFAERKRKPVEENFFLGSWGKGI